jgi:hypothetical protein
MLRTLELFERDVSRKKLASKQEMMEWGAFSNVD